MVLHRRPDFNSSTTSFQLRISTRRLPKFRSMTQLVLGRKTPKALRPAEWAAQGAPGAEATLRFRYPTRRETCMLFISLQLASRGKSEEPSLISFRTKWYFSNSYLPDDRRTPPEENLSDSLGFQTRIRLRLCELLDRAPRRVLASAHYVQWTRSFLDSGSVLFEFQFIYTLPKTPRIDLSDTFMQL